MEVRVGSHAPAANKFLIKCTCRVVSAGVLVCVPAGAASRCTYAGALAEQRRRRASPRKYAAALLCFVACMLSIRVADGAPLCLCCWHDLHSLRCNGWAAWLSPYPPMLWIFILCCLTGKSGGCSF